ncbi:MAG: hypothetical protein K2I69_04435 [Muribaculaceae bacterium]|nr:hypothetical protein [Muribaculaceae bacterium]
MNRTRATALIVTALAALLLVLLLSVCRLSFDASSLIPSRQPVAEVAEIDMEFVEFIDTRTASSTPSEAYTPKPQNLRSTAADASGASVADKGPSGAAPVDVTSTRPSEVKRPVKENTAPTGPSKAELEEQARRKVQKGVADAFKPQPEATDNTTNKGTDKGDSGKPDGSESTTNGTGSGTVGGGWLMPRFAKVNTSLTGSITLRAVVNAQGNVVSVEQTGGKAPAGTNSALVAKCIAEVKSRRFTRNDDNAPERAIATITYTFR